MLSESLATLLARLGFGARGLVYILVGWFAVDAAFRGGRTADREGAIASLAHQPLGRVLVAIIALGLIGYALWRLAEAVTNPERIRDDVKGVLKRLGYALSAAAHALLAWSAITMAWAPRSAPNSSSPDDAQARDWTAWLLSQPLGRLLVAAIAAVLLVAAFKQAEKAWKADFARELRLETPAPAYLCTFGQLGYGARALVFAVLALFFAAAAWESQASEAGGMGEALATLQRQPGGTWILVLTGVGLLLFGVYGFIEARFRRVRVQLPH